MLKVAYLLGAGATQSELDNIGWNGSVLMKNLKRPIHEKALKEKKYNEIFEDEVDIEQMISLLDDLNYLEYSGLPDKIRKLFFKEILSNMMKGKKMAHPRYLKLLLQLHKNYSKYMGVTGETLEAVLTLNFDSLIDQAFDKVYGSINYGVNAKSKDFRISRDIPKILKLHGSFNWSSVTTGTGIVVNQNLEFKYGEKSLCLPPSIYKKTFVETPPYNQIWTGAREVLENCDILRVLGCSLRKEDWPLISLIFTSQVRSKNKFSIELIVPIDTATRIQDDFVFLGNLHPFKSKRKDVFFDWIIKKYEEVANRTDSIGKDDLVNEILGL